MVRSLAAYGLLLLMLCFAGCAGDDPGSPTGDITANDVQSPDLTVDGGPSVDGGAHTSDHPGRVTWRRMNRTEYNNTVRDLLHTTLRPADDFPADDIGYGFDNIASVLSLSPLHLELYERAAQLLAEESMRLPVLEPIDVVVEAESEEVTTSTGGAYRGQGWNLWSSGQLTATVTVPLDGEYVFKARVWGQQAGPDWVAMAFVVNGTIVKTVEVEAEVDNPQTYSANVSLPEGDHLIAVEFLNDYYKPESGEDRNLIIDWIGLSGPNGLPGPEAWPYTKLMTCDVASDGADACGREILGSLARRAWRRPVTDDELNRLMALVTMVLDDEQPFEMAIQIGIEAILLSPHFIFKTEFNDAPDDPKSEALTGHELAARLSYLLWSSMPDDELALHADDGSLVDAEVLVGQVSRMLTDPKASALADNFASQWLYIRDILNVFPDPWVFPGFDEALRDAMRLEMLQFFTTFVNEDRSMLELLSAKETFVNQRLADHYGLDMNIPEGEWIRVSLEGTERRGLLTQAGLLTVLSTPFRTSIVRRGKWVLEQILCEGPPPPPPGVEADLGVEEGEEPKTLREMMEQHAADPLCVACHQLMDPIGFGLENFDGIGQWREEDSGFPIDASGTLPGELAFDGPEELIELVTTDDRLPGCIVEKTFIYAMGRGIKDEDEPYLEAITDAFVASDYRFKELLIQIVKSPPFRYRMGEIPPEETP